MMLSVRDEWSIRNYCLRSKISERFSQWWPLRLPCVVRTGWDLEHELTRERAREFMHAFGDVGLRYVRVEAKIHRTEELSSRNDPIVISEELVEEEGSHDKLSHESVEEAVTALRQVRNLPQLLESLSTSKEESWAILESRLEAEPSILLHWLENANPLGRMTLMAGAFMFGTRKNFLKIRAMAERLNPRLQLGDLHHPADRLGRRSRVETRVSGDEHENRVRSRSRQHMNPGTMVYEDLRDRLNRKRARRD